MNITLIPTFSPQGDGNFAVARDVEVLDDGVVDPYLFPARGRKLPSHNCRTLLTYLC